MTIATKQTGDQLTAAEVNTIDDALDAVIASNSLKAPLASPIFTGTPAGPTAAGGTNTTQLATTAYVVAAIAALPAQDATLTALGGVTVAANQLIYATGPDAFAVTSLTAFARTILDDADGAAVRNTISAAGSGAITSSGLTMSTARLLGRSTAGTGAVEELTVSATLDLVGSTRGAILRRGASGWEILAPGTSGQVLKSAGAGADPSWQNESGGGGAEVNAWALPAALSNPSSPVTPPAITGSTIIRMTGITGAKTVNMPAVTGTGRIWAMFDITATGGPFNVTFVGPTHDGIGADPTLVLAVPADGRGTQVFYTDDAGSTWRYSGNYDFAANKAAVLTALGLGTLKARFEILAPADGTQTLLLENFNIGTVVSALVHTDQGSATLNLRIADKTGPTNYAATGAASITGLSALSVTTTPARTAASGANTMARSGEADRILQAVLTSVSGSPNVLVIEVEYQL